MYHPPQTNESIYSMILISTAVIAIRGHITYVMNYCVEECFETTMALDSGWSKNM